MALVLVVDDEIGIRELLSEILADEGHTVLLAENAEAARGQRRKQRPDLVLLDIWMPDTDGISLLKEWNTSGQLTMPVVMMSGHGTIDTAVEATRIGAVDFLEKPISLQKLLATVKKALKPVAGPQKAMLSLEDFPHSPVMRDLRKRLEQAAARTSVVLLKGITGLMAEICARTLHGPNTPWLDFSSMNSPVTQELLQKNAGGLIYVPDLATLGKLQQMSLAFALERLSKHQMRLVVATAKSLEQLLEQGWEPQLLQRLAEVWVAMPTLVVVGNELPEICSLLLTRWVDHGEVPPKRLAVGALNRLRLHRWQNPGDGGWGELLSVIRNLALTCLEEEISEEEVRRVLPEEQSESRRETHLDELFAQPLREAREAFEKQYFEHLLASDGQNMSRVAEKSGLERTHLYRKLKQLGIAVGKKSGESGEA